MKRAPAITITHYKRDADDDVEQRPLEFRLIQRLFVYTRAYRAKRNILFALALIRAIQLPVLAWWIGAVIKGPTIIGENCEIRSSAYIRGNVITGNGCVLGNASEFKNCILFNHAQVPHFSYVGDSILGHKAHLGAGVVLSNLKSTTGNVKVNDLDTGLRKFGAIIGDEADIGCNCVLNPGSVIGRRAILYPNVLWRGVCPAGKVVKLRQVCEMTDRATSR